MNWDCPECFQPSLEYDPETKKIRCAMPGCGYRVDNVDMEAIEVIFTKDMGRERSIIFAG